MVMLCSFLLSNRRIGETMGLLQRASQVQRRFKLCVYGGPSTGKTILALTFPKPAYIDMEGGVNWYIGRKIIPEQNTEFLLKQTDMASEVLKVISEVEQCVKESPGTIETLVIDPVSVFWDALQDGFLKKLQAGNKNAEIKFNHWKQIKAPYKRAITKLINLPVHLVLIGREAIKYKMEKGQLIEDGTTIQTEKDTPYIADIFVKMGRAADADGNVRFIAEIEKDRTNMMKVGDRVENLTFQKLLEMARGAGILDSIQGAQGGEVKEVVDAAAVDQAIFDEEVADDTQSDVQSIITEDEDIVKLWQELDWKPGKVLAMVNKEGFTTREEVGKFLAKRVRDKRNNEKVSKD